MLQLSAHSLPTRRFTARRFTTPCLILGSILGCFAMTGCTLLQRPGKSDSPYIGSDPSALMDASENEQTYNAVRQAQARNAIVLHVVGDSDPLRVLPLPNEGQSVLVSDLLRQSGVSEKLGGVSVMLYRKANGAPGSIRMSVAMDAKGEGVQPASDYSLQPGDRIQVTRRSSDALQSVVSSLGLPF